MTRTQLEAVHDALTQLVDAWNDAVADDDCGRGHAAIALALYDDGSGRLGRRNVRVGDPTCPIYLNGAKYDIERCLPQMEPHHEIMRWFAFCGEFKVAARKGGGYDFTTLEGKELETYLERDGLKVGDKKLLASAFGHKLRTLAECRALWRAEWAGDGSNSPLRIAVKFCPATRI